VFNSARGESPIWSEVSTIGPNQQRGFVEQSGNAQRFGPCGDSPRAERTRGAAGEPQTLSRLNIQLAPETTAEELRSRF
jgi:hypothetical protein